jgi:hypothetical protein
VSQLQRDDGGDKRAVSLVADLMASSLHSEPAEVLNSMVNTLSFNNLHGEDDKRHTDDKSVSGCQVQQPEQRAPHGRGC